MEEGAIEGPQGIHTMTRDHHSSTSDEEYEWFSYEWEAAFYHTVPQPEGMDEHQRDRAKETDHMTFESIWPLVDRMLQRVQAKYQAEIEALRAELKSEMEAVRADMEALRAEVRVLQARVKPLEAHGEAELRTPEPKRTKPKRKAPRSRT